MRGFTRGNPFCIRQFYDTYQDDTKVSALLTQLPWTYNKTLHASYALNVGDGGQP